ncbi:unnamed protein product [Withania somnifera]
MGLFNELPVAERGEIFFFYRPKVGKQEAHDPDDVQRLYIVLRPESAKRSVEVKQDPHSGKEGEEIGSHTDFGKPNRDIKKHSAGEGGHGTGQVNIEKEPLLRFIVMGRKSLPDPSKTKGHRPYWAALKGEEYDTSTRGHRAVAPARAVGEGIYRILRHNPNKRMHTNLVYKLEFPAEDEKNEPQEVLNIKREGSFLIQIKNPEQPGGSQFRGPKKKRKATFPAHLQGEFGQLRYHPADQLDFLNYEGCEFLLISASDDIEEELELELKTETEAEHDPSCSDLVRTFGETAPIRALLRGTWV